MVKVDVEMMPKKRWPGQKVSVGGQKDQRTRRRFLRLKRALNSWVEFPETMWVEKRLRGQRVSKEGQRGPRTRKRRILQMIRMGCACYNVDGEDSVRRKSKQGRPKGSKTKRKDVVNDKSDDVPVLGENTKDLVAVATPGNEVGNEIVSPKTKLGRPKGSKTKRNLTGEENHGTTGSGAVAVGIDISVPPFGLEKRMIALMGEQNRKMEVKACSGYEFGDEIVQLKKKGGLPTKTIPVNDGNSAISSETSGRNCTGGLMACLMGLENERPNLVSKGEKGLPGESTCGSEFVQPKVKRGRSKDPKKNKKKLVDTENQEIPGDILGANDGTDRTLLVTGLKNERPVLTGEKDMQSNKGAFDSNEHGYETAQPKNKRGRPKGSKTKKKKVSGQDNQRNPSKFMSGNDGKVEVFCSTGLENEIFVGKEGGDCQVKPLLKMEVEMSFYSQGIGAADRRVQRARRKIFPVMKKGKCLLK
ncbi:uncharacterized protein Pyn_24808 [Prunus yedoensis var. nudiflora]|uniref:Uncharacterized protein n=1 Tax=Prunus yedoensis var. nudiflora TaxID=2094558 RepID=A0A314YAB2_PRUYE|nr:uncharacterized protein Pyn_24808 [Prunus yedoensis var. nudiflora]